MKSKHTSRKSVALLAAALLPTLACSTVSAQQTNNSSASVSNSSCNSGHCHKAWKSLSESERQQLVTDMKSIHQDPQLLAARQAVKEAQTKEARTAARTSLRQIRHDLLVKADPSIEPVLAKLNQGNKEQ